MSIRVVLLFTCAVWLVNAYAAKNNLEDLIAEESSLLEASSIDEEPAVSTEESKENVPTVLPDDVNDDENADEESETDESSTVEADTNSDKQGEENESETKNKATSDDNADNTDSAESNNTDSSDGSYKPDYSEDSENSHKPDENTEHDENVNNVSKELGYYSLNFIRSINGVAGICRQFISLDTGHIISEKCDVSGYSPLTFNTFGPPLHDYRLHGLTHYF